MLKSELLRAIQQEIQRHDFSHFVENPSAVAQGGVQQSGRANRGAFPPRCFFDYLYCLRLDANCLGMGCLGQFDLQNAIFQHRVHLRAVDLRR
jgi:hypothetical protein